MGMVAVASAVRPDDTSDREQFESELRASMSGPSTTSVEFKLSLDSIWMPMLTEFSGGWYDPSAGRYDRLGKGNEGVWAVRGRHRVLPRPDDDDPRYEVSLFYNDGGDVAAIADWLKQEPPNGVSDGLRARLNYDVPGDPVTVLWEYLGSFYRQSLRSSI